MGHRISSTAPAAGHAADPRDPQEGSSRRPDGACARRGCETAYPGSWSRGRPGPLFYETTPERRAERDAVVGLVDRFGTHLLCPRRECRRAGRCRDGHMGALPFCFWHFRGTLRFTFALMTARLEAGGDAAPRADAEGTGGKPPTSLLAELRAAGWPLDHLRRPRDAGPDEYGWETDPEALTLLAEARAGAGRTSP